MRQKFRGNTSFWYVWAFLVFENKLDTEKKEKYNTVK